MFFDERSNLVVLTVLHDNVMLPGSTASPRLTTAIPPGAETPVNVCWVWVTR